MRYAIRFIPVAVLAVLLAPALATGETADPGWPREFSAADGRKLLLYQPQIESWEDYARIESSVAVGVYAAGADEPVFGALRVTADTETNLESRTVYVSDIRIEEVGFPAADAEDVAALERTVRELFPDEPVCLSLDRLLADAERSHVAARAAEISIAPPRILWSRRPAILLLFDGDPAFERIEGTELLGGLNTAWDVFLELGPSRYFLRYDGAWLTAQKLEGPWRVARELPAAFAKLPDEEPWKEARQHLRAGDLPPDEVPTVFLATEPTELIVTDGEPRLTPIPGTRLMYVSNTDSDLFLDPLDGQYYYLVSGRWFRGKALDQRWTAVDADLPPEFARIPADHPCGHVLASVPGTAQAKRAVLLSQVPRTATVQRDVVTVVVTYEGDPVFEPIPGTVLYYAVNTPHDVVRYRARYYLCHKGIWFVAVAAYGPWVVCDAVPAVIYTIPAYAPLHHVTYVYVYVREPGFVVFGYTGGYIGLFVWHGRLVFGTGYYHRHHPAWYRYIRRHRLRVVSDAGWGRARPHRVYAYGSGARYDSRRGVFVRGGRAYGPDRGAVSAAIARQRTNAYTRWAGAHVQRRDEARVVRPSPTPARTGTVAKGRPDVYVGRDGRIYERRGTEWFRRDGRTWKRVEPVAPPKRVTPTPRTEPPQRRTPTRAEVQRRLEQDAKARRDGAARAARAQRDARPARRTEPRKPDKPRGREKREGS